MASQDLRTSLQNANDYYIHLNKINIGTRANNAMINFMEQKQQIKMQTMAQYKQFFDASLNKQSLDLLSASLELDEETFLSVLNHNLQEKLQQDINIEKLSTLYQTVQSGDISRHLKQAVKDNNVKQLSLALEGIANCLFLLERGDSSLGAVVLYSLQHVNSFSDIGEKLSILLEQYEIKNNYRLIKRQSLEKAKKQLDNLAQALSTGKFVSTKNELTAQGLSTLLLNGIVSTSIAEGLGFAMSGKAGSVLYNSILETVGTKAVTVQSDSKKIKITGKTDVQAKGVSISLNATDTGIDGGKINLNIGISSKFYTGQGFKDLNNKSVSISSGSGGTLKQALDSIFSDSTSRYLAYNYITHDQYVEQLNDLIAKRQILRLFATAGSKEDFSQFMLINGYVVSIWDIVQYVLNTDVGLSKSMEGSKNQGIVVSIPDRKKIHEANVFDQVAGDGDTPILSAWKRSHNVNSAIDSARIQAELHLMNLAKTYKPI